MLEALCLLPCLTRTCIPAQALGPGRPDVVLVHNLDHRGTRHLRREGREDVRRSHPRKE